MSNNLQHDFNGQSLTVIPHNNDFYLSTEQIAQALDYHHKDAIIKIYNRNKELLDDYSVKVKLTGTDGKSYKQRVFNEEGIMLIAMKSKQPKAISFQKWAVKVLKQHRASAPMTATLAPSPAISTLAASPFHTKDYSPLLKGIRVMKDLYRLNDVHGMAGALNKQQPHKFLCQVANRKLVNDLVEKANHPHKVIGIKRKGQHMGTYACQTVLLAYARWCDPKLAIVLHDEFEKDGLAKIQLVTVDRLLTLSPFQKSIVRRQVKAMASFTQTYQHIYGRLNETFNVASYHELLACDFPAICRHLGLSVPSEPSAEEALRQTETVQSEMVTIPARDLKALNDVLHGFMRAGSAFASMSQIVQQQQPLLEQVNLMTQEGGRS